MLEEFRHIAETAIPQPIQSRLVTPDEARAVITSFNRLTNRSLRENFLSLPVDNIIEFSLIQTKKQPSLYTYMNGSKLIEEAPVEEPAEPAPQPIPEAERDHLDQPAPIEVKPKTRKKRVAEIEQPIVPEPPRSDEKFFTHLTERLELLIQQQPPPIVVETTDRHVEKLFEIEQTMLGTLDIVTERMQRLVVYSDDTRIMLTEMLDCHKTVLDKIGTTITESQTRMDRIQATQAQIVETIAMLVEKMTTLTQVPPVVNPVINVPAPIVNVSIPDGRRIKMVERDENGMISKITEE